MAPDTTLIEYPRVFEYVEALQHPDRCFRDPALRAAAPDTDGRGDPLPRTGGHAAVFKLVRGPTATAVKVFKNPRADRQARYKAVSEHLARQPSPYLVGFRYDPQGVRVAGRWYPLLAMDWVDGVPLMRWVGERVGRRDAAALAALADRWVEMLRQLQARQVAHGDLQHGNVLVVDGEPVLVDYDGMGVPALAGQESLEGGLPGYQHPGREGQPLSPRLDDFAAWVIWLALRGLAADLSLWRRFVERPDNENLLFTDADLVRPQASALWDALVRSPDAEVGRHAAVLRAACHGPFDRVPPFSFEAPPLIDPAGDTLDLDAGAMDTVEAPPRRATEPPVRGTNGTALRRDACLAALACVPREPTEAADRAFLAAWQDDVLAGASEAEPFRPRLHAARAGAGPRRADRRATPAPTRRRSNWPAGCRGSTRTTPAASAGWTRRTRAAAARRRPALDAGHPALSDLALAAAWEDYTRAGGALADPGQHERCLLAVRRRQALSTFRQATPGLPVDLADANVLLCWREGDLGDCPDVTAHERQRVDEARRRSALWHDLEEALRRGDPRDVERLLASPLLTSYPPLARRRPEVDALLRQGAAVGHLLDVLRSHRADDAPVALDLSPIAAHPRLFLPLAEPVRAMLAREVGRARLRSLADPEVLAGPADGWGVVVRWGGWTWATFGLGERTCRWRSTRTASSTGPTGWPRCRSRNGRSAPPAGWRRPRRPGRVICASPSGRCCGWPL
ncbi:MAG: hypothetical protein U0736_22715 [Gemmataceae bacterium]